MKMIKEYIYKNEISLLISFLIGFGLATMFRQVCNDDRCRVVKGPKPEEVEGKTFQTADGCFQYKQYPVKCNKNTPKRTSLSDEANY